MAKNFKLHTYIRVDASGRDVPGTNILRLKRPVTGNWREVTAYQCCTAFTLVSSTPADVTLSGVTFTLSCDAEVISVNNISTATTTLAGIVTLLNANLSYYGKFVANGTAIDLEFNSELATALCPDGTLTFVITETV